MVQFNVLTNLDLSTTSNPEEKVCVDRKLLQMFFKGYGPANLDSVKVELMGIIESSETLESMNTDVSEYLYKTGVATEFLEDERKRELEQYGMMA